MLSVSKSVEEYLIGCEFNNVTFKNVNFGKTELDYSKILTSTFVNCTLIKISSNESHFEDLHFQNCKLVDAFSNSKINNILFEEYDFNGVEFWECIISNLKFKNSNFYTIDSIKNINIGSLEQPIIISGDEAIHFFKEHIQVN